MAACTSEATSPPMHTGGRRTQGKPQVSDEITQSGRWSAKRGIKTREKGVRTGQSA